MDNDEAKNQFSESTGKHGTQSLRGNSSSPEKRLEADTLPTAEYERGTRLYLKSLRNCLTRVLFDRDFSVAASTGKRYPRNLEKRPDGRDWPAEAEKMVGVRRLEHLELCIADVLRRNVAGDLVEAGVWRGGAAIFMRAALEAFGDSSRVVWAADSYLGPPAPDPLLYPQDRASKLHQLDFLSVPQDEVKRNFARYDLLDETVRFISGWFRESLPVAPIDNLAILHMDGDLYESTMVALRSLYDKLSVGGYVIVDDYYSSRGCRQAVDEFRAEQGILDPLIGVDWTSVYWQRKS